MESRTQGSRPRPRTQKKSEAKAKDSLCEDRHSRGQGQECSRPRTKDTSASALQKKKRSSQKFFKRSPQKNVFQKIVQALHKILTIKKIVLFSSRGQTNFQGLEASRPRPRTWPSRPRTSKCVLRAKDVLEDSTSGYDQRWSRGHKARGQGHKKIRGQGQGQPLRRQTLSRPRTGMLEAKDQGHPQVSSKKKVFKKVFRAFSNL